jgi:hypothetical protein
MLNPMCPASGKLFLTAVSHGFVDLVLLSGPITPLSRLVRDNDARDAASEGRPNRRPGAGSAVREKSRLPRQARSEVSWTMPPGASAAGVVLPSGSPRHQPAPEIQVISAGIE